MTMRRYSAPLSLTSIVCFLGTLQSIAVTFVMEHKPSAWSIGWDINLLAAAYAVSLFLSLYIHVLTYINMHVMIYKANMLHICVYAGYSVIRHSILCSRTSDGEERSCFRHSFQPSDDDHCGCPGLFHPRWKDLPWRVIFPIQ